MILLALTSRLTAASHGDLSPLLDKGDLLATLVRGKKLLEHTSDSNAFPMRADQGRLLGRIMLACGREEEAEELFQQQFKVYAAISRDAVRWNSSLDQAAMQLHLNKLNRAIECFCSVADDRRAPDNVRLEAIAYAAVAMQRSGDCRAARQSLEVARRLAKTMNDHQLEQLVECLALEQAVLQRERAGNSLSDHALCELYREAGINQERPEESRQRLAAFAASLTAKAPLAAQRMSHLLHLIECDSNHPTSIARVTQDIVWLTERRLVGLEVHARAEAALILVASGAFAAAGQLLQAQCYQEHQIQHHRYALDLQYCLAKICQNQNRHVEALRLYWHHSRHAVRSIKADSSHKKMPAFLDTPKEPQEGEAAKLRLPLRYRHAYQYIIDHLNDERLSVYQVATHINVTERALQMAFRAHLGLTPAELIRTRRMERIHDELRDQAGNERVLEVASRWGITNRSTLAHNYRARFAQTPTQTLQGAW